MLNKLKVFIKKYWLFILIIIIFIALRLINISQEEYWYDEYYNLLIAKNLSFSQIVNYVPHVRHPPVYYWIMHPWLNFFGIEEFWGRLPSIFFSLLALIMSLKIVKLITNNKSSIFFCLFLFTFSAFNVEYSQEARSYTLALFEYLLIFYIILKSIKQNRLTKKNLLLLILIGSISLYTHYLFIVYFAGLIISIIIFLFLKPEHKKVLSQLIIAFCIIFITFIPWINNITNSYTIDAYSSVIKEQSSLILLISSLQYYYFIYSNLFLINVSFLLVIGIIFISIFKLKTLKYDRLLILLINIIFTLILIYFSPLNHRYSYTWQRHILILYSLFVIYISVFSFQILRNAFIRNAFIIFIFFINIVSLPIVYNNDSKWFYHYQHKTLVKFIAKNEHPNDLILVPRMTREIMINRYYRGYNKITNILYSSLNRNNIPEIEMIDMLRNQNMNYKNTLMLNNLKLISVKYKRIWLVNNYNLEDEYAIKYFKNNPDFKINTISQFKNSRLLLIEKINNI